uniref:Endonuclease/exonuclease/phosphatase domain-containing protein n=1 Tax=Arion vulgaris TaxID=1028688 RepID=A0A0B7BHA2_9EUPU
MELRSTFICAENGSAELPKKNRTRGQLGRRKRKRRSGVRKSRPKTERLGLKHIRILYWNCRSVRQRGPVLEKLIYEADIIALQETRLHQVDRLKFAGSNAFRNDTHLDQTVLVRKDLPGLGDGHICMEL